MGRLRPGSAFSRVPWTGGGEPAAHQEGKTWTFFIRIVLALMCTRTWWWRPVGGWAPTGFRGRKVKISFNTVNHADSEEAAADFFCRTTRYAHKRRFARARSNGPTRWGAIGLLPRRRRKKRTFRRWQVRAESGCFGDREGKKRRDVAQSSLCPGSWCCPHEQLQRVMGVIHGPGCSVVGVIHDPEFLSSLRPWRSSHSHVRPAHRISTYFQANKPNSEII